RMPRWLRPAVHRIMFRCRDHAEILRIISLQSCHKRDTHASSQKRIFAVSFLPASPSWIAEYIDIRRPEIESLHDVPPSCSNGLLVFRPSLSPDDNRHLVNERIVKSSRQAHGFRKNCGRTSISNTVERFAPPVISWDPEIGDSPRLIDQLLGLLLQTHVL